MSEADRKWMEEELMKDQAEGLVAEEDACPECNERDGDSLINNPDSGIVYCISCGHVYDPIGKATAEEIKAEEIRIEDSIAGSNQLEDTMSELYGEQMDMS